MSRTSFSAPSSHARRLASDQVFSVPAVDTGLRVDAGDGDNLAEEPLDGVAELARWEGEGARRTGTLIGGC
jgi:hypothetical protein